MTLTLTPLGFIGLGFLGGLFVTVPLGPVNVMIIQRAFRYGFVAGISAGFGAAVADLIFAVIAAFGLSAVTSFIEGHSQVIQLVGGTVVAIVGLRILFFSPSLDSGPVADEDPRGSLQVAAATFALTITNPATIFGFFAYFSALGQWGPQKNNPTDALLICLGVGLGVLGWWFTLSALVTRLRVRLNERFLSRVNIVAGAILVGFGALILGRLSVTYLEMV
ncbi:MAG: LysE family transporter [Pseudomonadota bacterium]